MPQYKVPQNIDLEDKIVGPFTMKQFVYLMVGGGLIYGLYQGWIDYENGILYTILAAIPIGALAMALTFVKVNDRPFEFFLVNLISYITKPKKRLWQQGYEPPKVTFITPKADQPLPATNANARHATLEEIAGHLEAQSANTGSVLPASQAKDSGPGSQGENAGIQVTGLGTQDSGSEKPETRDQRPETQPPDARFTADDLAKGRAATMGQRQETGTRDTPARLDDTSRSDGRLGVQEETTEAQGAKLQAPKLGTWVEKSPEPETTAPPAHSVVESVKGIFSRFGKKNQGLGTQGEDAGTHDTGLGTRVEKNPEPGTGDQNPTPANPQPATQYSPF